MSTCFNVRCLEENSEEARVCRTCGATLVIQDRYRAVRLLQPLESVSFRKQVFEVKDIISNKLYVLCLLQADERLLRSIDWTRLLLGQVHAVETSVHFPTIESNASFECRLLPSGRLLHGLVIEKVEGINLDEWLSRYGRIPQSVAIDWMIQVVDAVSQMHQHGFIHRDIKPSNIILRPDGNLTLIDFDSVCRTDFDYLANLNAPAQYPSESVAVGTPGYMAPEQMDGQALRLSDYFSIGRTFCHLVTGVAPVRLPRMKNGQLNWRSSARQISPVFASFIDRLMAPNAIERPASRSEIISYLKSLPRRLRWRNMLHSRAGKVIVALLVGLLLAGVWSGTSSALFYFYAAEANEYRIQGNDKAAQESYGMALRFRQNSDLYVSLGVVCQTTGDTGCAVSSFQKAIQKNPASAPAYFNLANLYENQQNYALAESLYEDAAKLDSPVRYDAINNMARLHLLQNELSQAVKLIQPALKVATDPITQSAMYKNLGWAAFKQKQYSQSQVYLKKSIKLDPTRADAYCILALVNRAVGEDSTSNSLTCIQLPTTADQPEVQQWKRQLVLPNNPS